MRKRRVFEVNIVLDTPDLTLRRSTRLVRLREAGRRSVLTYKGRPKAGRHKSREELEIEISNVQTAQTIFRRLGFRPVFRYEKFRTEYAMPKGPGVATLDETPIGCFLELEGPARWIDRTAKALGFAQSDHITGSYGELYLAFCKRAGVAPTHMVFDHGAPGFKDTGGK